MRRQRGFSLLEVMIALAILGMALVMLLRMSSIDIAATERAKLMTVGIGLARSEMYEIEEGLLKNGFQDTTQNINGDFADMGWKSYTWDAIVEKVELPEADAMKSEKDAKNGNSATAMPGSPADSSSAGLGFGSGGGAGGLGGGMVQMYFPIIKPVLESAIRKVTLTVKWKVGKDEESFKTICFFTDTKAVDAAMKTAPGASSTTSTPTTPTTPITSSPGR